MTEKPSSPASSGPSPKDVNAVNNWALRMYRELLNHNHANQRNLIFSPTILLLNLQQAHLASQGKCQEQIDKLLKMPDESVQAVLHELSSLIDGGEASKLDRSYDFFAGTNILLNDQDVALQPKCLEDLKNLPAGMRKKKRKDGDVVEYVENSDMKAIDSFINQLAKEITLDRIHTVTTDQPLTIDNHSLLLLSVAHFYSDWENKFIERSCVNYEGRNRSAVQALPATIEDFHNADGTTAKVLMLHLQGKIFLTRDDKLKVTIAELPMNQYTSSLLIVLPDADAGKNALKHFEENFKEETFEILRQNWQMPLTHCYLPKFSLENHFSLSKHLQNLGVKDLFSPTKADLSNLSSSKSPKTYGAPGLHVADILHSASIDISCESGKALPISPERAGQCSGALMPDTFATGFHVDRPFFFLVRPRTPEMWCMMGRVVHLADEADVTVWNHHKHQ